MVSIILNPEEMLEVFPYAKEAIENTYEIAKRCNVTISFGEYKLPVYPVPQPYSPYEYLKLLCQEVEGKIQNHYTKPS